MDGTQSCSVVVDLVFGNDPTEPHRIVIGLILPFILFFLFVSMFLSCFFTVVIIVEVTSSMESVSVNVCCRQSPPVPDVCSGIKVVCVCSARRWS